MDFADGGGCGRSFCEVKSLSEWQDTIVLIIIVLALVIWIGFRLKKWLDRPWMPFNPYVMQADPPKKDVVHLLEKHGYDVVCGKYKVDLRMDVSGKKLQSRLFIDGIARDEDGTYILKRSNDRKPIDWTGAGVRDAFLPIYAFHLPYRISGVLYIDMSSDHVRKITFDWDEKI